MAGVKRMDLREKIKKVGIYLRYYFSYLLNRPLIYPKEVNFQMTNRCTLQCKMCNIWKLPREKEEISVDEMKRILSEVKNWKNTKYVSFVGGESLIRMEETLELIEYANSLGFHTNLVSNATLLNEAICKRLVEVGLDRIALSLDGAKRETHDFIRGKGNFNQVIKAAKIFLKLKKDYHIKVDFTSVLMSYNFREFVDLYWLGKKIGVDQWFIQCLVLDNTFRSFDYNSPLWIKEGQLEKLKEVVNKLIELKIKDKNFIHNSIDYLRAIPKYFELKKNFKLGKCMAGYFTLNIDPYGNINICNFGPNINLIGKDVNEAWKNEKFKRTRILIKECKNPCMMLCYQRFSFPELLRTFLSGD
ncbi:MAG: radical SAM protein [Candidatus Aenigmatarchaeota archaeon]